MLKHESMWVWQMLVAYTDPKTVFDQVEHDDKITLNTY